MYKIYEIRNLKEDKCYIGQTCRFHDRILRHKRELKKNIHHSILMQESFNKNSDWDNDWNVKILYDDLTKEEADSLEFKLINDDWENNYNVSKNVFSGDNVSYHPNNESIRNKTSKTMKKIWKNMTEEEREYRKSLVQGENNPRYDVNSTHHQRMIRMNERTPLEVFAHKYGSPTAKPVVFECYIFPSISQLAICLSSSLDAIERRINDSKIKNIHWATEEDLNTKIITLKDSEEWKIVSLMKIPEINSTQRVYCEGIIFDAIKRASEHYGVSSTTIINRCKSEGENWKEFYYIH